MGETCSRLSDVTRLYKATQGRWMDAAPCDLFYIFSLLLLHPRLCFALPLGWGSFRGPEVTSFALSQQRTPRRASLFVTLFSVLASVVFFPFPSYHLLLLLPSRRLLPSPPIPHGGAAAAVNAKKRRASTYITPAVQLMSWSISAV